MTRKAAWTFSLAAAVIVTALAILGTSNYAGSADGDGIGRYQIVTGIYDITGQSGTGVTSAEGYARGVFKIDTVTGQTWVYAEEVLYKGMVIERTQRHWGPIE